MSRLRRIVLKVALPVACGAAVLALGVAATGPDASVERTDQSATLTALDFVWG